MNTNLGRRDFILSSSTLMMGTVLFNTPLSAIASSSIQSGRIGIIGLDTSHSVAFTRVYLHVG